MLLDLKAPVFLLVTDKPHCRAVERARQSGIEVDVIDVKGGAALAYRDLLLRLRAKQINGIVLLGYMRILPPDFVEPFAGKIINLHPSLLPAYPGLRAIERSFQDRAAMGVTLHFVDQGLDSGPIIKQIKVFERDAYEGLSFAEAKEKIKAAEHRLMQDLVAGDIKECL